VQTQWSTWIDAALRDVPTILRREEYVLLMVQRWSDAASKDVQINHKREEYVSHMARRWSDAASRGVPIKLSRGEFVVGIARKAYVIAINNPSLEAISELPSIPPPHQSINYEDEEEELNSWIWRSSRIPRKFVERPRKQIRIRWMHTKPKYKIIK
jgi:hypothetical protein